MDASKKKLLRVLSTGAAIAAIAAVHCGSAAAATLDTLRQDKTLRIAVRDDAPPFSYKNDKGEPAGFMVDLCRRVAHDLSEQLNLGELKVAYVPVTAADCFEAIQTGKADLLCEPTSATLTRREHVDFSIPTFVDGASLMVKGSGPSALKDLAGKKVGVLGGTTTEKELRDSLRVAGIAAEVVTANTHEEGLAMLDKDEVAAYFGDMSILAFLGAKSSNPAKLSLAREYLTVEPYALALPRGDSDFRLEVDRALSRIYRSGEISAIFAGTFGAKAEPGDILKALYVVSALPE